MSFPSKTSPVKLGPYKRFGLTVNSKKDEEEEEGNSILIHLKPKDKINLKEETPSTTSRIQLRKEMNMILTPPLTKETEEDDASQIYYMSKLIGEV
ncbi:hypothetical protein CMV_026645 [Castanea mollissima]|uniref:Uncharacterized protein n=1 Tax=Castanea mollissima TaxID=60419 RepID=A0A8J4QJM6_9ROSI|nr:hypothetical protein CMV_026645 [Castanea mollissima]